MKPNKSEQKVIAFITKKFKFQDLKIHDRTHLTNPETRRRLELDIYIPCITTGIEIQGVFHSWNKQKRRDYIKKILCNRQRIHLLLIDVPITTKKLLVLQNEIENILHLKK